MLRWAATRRTCSSSAARTCRARARCCAPSASTPSSRWRARRCGAMRLRAVAAACRRDASRAGLAAGGAVALLRRDHCASATSSTLRRGAPPLLFLLDEILPAPTRTIAASAPRRSCAALVDRGAIGLVTTHDLALTEMADALAARARERALRRPHGRRRDAVRLPHARRHRPA